MILAPSGPETVLHSPQFTIFEHQLSESLSRAPLGLGLGRTASLGWDPWDAGDHRNLNQFSLLKSYLSLRECRICPDKRLFEKVSGVLGEECSGNRVVLRVMETAWRCHFWRRKSPAFDHASKTQETSWVYHCPLLVVMTFNRYR